MEVPFFAIMMLYVSKAGIGPVQLMNNIEPKAALTFGFITLSRIPFEPAVSRPSHSRKRW